MDWMFDHPDLVLAFVLGALGLLISMANWWCLVRDARGMKPNVSMVPLFGGLLLFGALRIIPSTRPVAWIGFAADPWWATLVAILPRSVHEAWQTSRFNLVGRFAADGTTLSLFKAGAFVMEVREPNGIRWLCGKWRLAGDAYTLNGFSGTREIRVVCNGDQAILEPSSTCPGEDEHSVKRTVLSRRI